MSFDALDGAVTSQGVRIGVIDSGVAAPADEIRIADGYNTLDGQSPDMDRRREGTRNAHRRHHRCYAGLARRPGSATIDDSMRSRSSRRADGQPGRGRRICIREKIDIICLSLGIDRPSQILAAAIRDAYDRGITCVAASATTAVMSPRPPPIRPTVSAPSADSAPSRKTAGTC